ncbi:hypothetical protein BC830DRAFT_704500 [Chytriomyces sp. MP71]|nr:hypothetical protein BC830DRAFT_704500 [Chytriomyces sp. MP71]
MREGSSGAVAYSAIRASSFLPPTSSIHTQQSTVNTGRSDQRFRHHEVESAQPTKCHATSERTCATMPPPSPPSYSASANADMPLLLAFLDASVYDAAAMGVRLGWEYAIGWFEERVVMPHTHNFLDLKNQQSHRETHSLTRHSYEGLDY